MEDAIEHPRETGDAVQQPEIEVAVDEGNSDGDNLRLDGNKSENEGGGADKVRKEGKNDAVCSGGEIVNAKDMTEEPIDPGCISEEPTADKGEVEKQTDVSAGVIKEGDVSGGVKEGILTDTSVEDGYHAKNLEERPSDETGEEMHEESGGEDRDSAENGAIGEKDLEDGTGTTDPEESMLISTSNGTPKTQSQNAVLDEVPLEKDEEMEDAADDTPVIAAKDEVQEQKKLYRASGGNFQKSKTAARHGDYPPPPDQRKVSLNALVRSSTSTAEDYSDQPMRTTHTQETLPLMPEDDDGSPEEQAAFMNEVESFYRQKGMDFKPPRFYQQPLNCLKLWRAVIRLGGYEKVTACKLWRQVGESFRPPKTCTTVSWTFRIFFEKALLEYEKYQIQIGALYYPAATLTEAPPLEKEGNGHPGSETGRARRDSAARAMQGWYAHRHSGNGEIGEPLIKSKNVNSMSKREKNIKNIGVGVGPLKQKRPNDLETSNKVARTEIPEQLIASVVDIGPPADWVKINVRQTIDCFEVYALVPGLIREEVRVQSDPAGRLVITGQPEQLDNPWGITPFKKVVTLPARIDPLHTSAVVSLHGGLFVRVPFEQQPAIPSS